MSATMARSSAFGLLDVESNVPIPISVHCCIFFSCVLICIERRYLKGLHHSLCTIATLVRASCFKSLPVAVDLDAPAVDLDGACVNLDAPAVDVGGPSVDLDGPSGVLLGTTGTSCRSRTIGGRHLSSE